MAAIDMTKIDMGSIILILTIILIFLILLNCMITKFSNTLQSKQYEFMTTTAMDTETSGG